MTAITEKKTQGLELERPAVYFTLDRNHSISNPIWQRPINCEDDDNSHRPDFSAIFSLDDPIVKNAVRNAFDGKPSQARFHRVTGKRNCYYDFYCFPNFGHNGSNVDCFLVDRSHDEETSRVLRLKIDGLDMINQAVRAFAETNNLSEILEIILLAVTSGSGLGFNRGFILLADETKSYLHGCLAKGPSSPEEAGIIWQSLSEKPLSLAEVLRLYKNEENQTDSYVNKLVESLKITLRDETTFIIRSFEERQAIVIGSDTVLNDIEKDFIEKFGTTKFAVAPLISRESRLGVIMADNYITDKPITSSDLKLLEIFARYASDAIENTHLHGSLQRKITKLKEANEKIIRTRETLVKAEKLSSVSQMSLEVAHEIRNPLTIIGGHANARLRNIDVNDQSCKVLKIISKQASRIEQTLNRFTSVISLSEKTENAYDFCDLILETLRALSSVESQENPMITIDANIESGRIFIDQGLFYKAMMVIFKTASKIAGGLSKVRIEIMKHRESAMVLINSCDKSENFSEKFFYFMRAGHGESESQEMTVALEILRHYKGDLGIGSPEKMQGGLLIEFPLSREE